MKVLDSISIKYRIQLSEKTYVDNDGYLVCEDAIFGRIGVQEYAKGELGIPGNPNEAVEVYRKPEYIFDEESLSTLDGKPLTLGHPKVKVNINNYNQFAKGFVQNVHHDDNNIIGDIRVTDKKVREIIESRSMRELSLGYDMVLCQDEENDNVYFCKDIVYNHLALVKQGRAGNAMILDEKSELLEGGVDTMLNEKQNVVVNDNVVEEDQNKGKEEDQDKVKDQAKENDNKVEDNEPEKGKEEDKKDDEDKQDKTEDACKDACKDNDKKDTQPDNDKKVEDEKKENKKMSLLDRAMEIDKIQDPELKQMLKDDLKKEMGVQTKVADENTTITKVDIKDNDNNDLISHADKMQAFYDDFDPHLYGNDCMGKEYRNAMKDKVISRKLEDTFRQSRINNK